MKTKYYFGRKNRRTNYRLYKEEICKDNNDCSLSYFFVLKIIKGNVSGWNQCGELPKDMKPIRKENAEEYLFMWYL